jgi:hypothetical protein
LQLSRIIPLAACLFLAACAGNRTATTSPPEDYVEIDNPGFTASPNQPAKIWVPRSYVEKGPLRGSELVKKGADKVVESFQKTPEQPQSVPLAQQPSATVPAPPAAVPASPPSAVATPQPTVVGARIPSQAPSAVKNRIALLEIGQNNLAQPLYEDLRRASAGVMIEPAQAAFLAQFATITTQAEKASFARRLQQDYGANVAVYVSAPEGVSSGKKVIAEVYDAMAGGLLRRFDAVIAPSSTADQTAGIAAALAGVAEKIRDLVALLPWYGRITEVDGNRAYIAAGKEAGLTIGQVLQVYRGGKFVEGLGYAPGEKIGTLVVGGFVGPNGSFGTVGAGQRVQAADVVSVE